MIHKIARNKKITHVRQEITKNKKKFPHKSFEINYQISQKFKQLGNDEFKSFNHNSNTFGPQCMTSHENQIILRIQ